MFGKEKDDLVTKSEPFRIHLTEQTDAWVEQEARRTRRPKEAIVEALVEDAVRMGRFPGIAFRGPDHDRRAWLLGTALDVWEVIEAYQGFGSLDRLLAEGDLPERQARLALAYYEEHPEEIDRAVADNQAPQEVLHKLYPSFVPEG